MLYSVICCINENATENIYNNEIFFKTLEQGPYNNFTQLTSIYLLLTNANTMLLMR